MTIQSQTSRISYTGDGSTTVFQVPFYFQQNSDLVVVVQDLSGNITTKVIGGDYTLSGAGSSTGGSCTFTTAPTTGYIIAIYRVPPITQTTSYNNNDPFPAKSHELALDKTATIDQYLKSLIDRAILVAPTDTPPMSTLPPASVRALKNFTFDGSGNPTVSTLATGVSVSAAMQPVVAASTLALARTALGIDAPIVVVSTNQTINTNNYSNRFVSTGAINFSLPRANTTQNGFGFHLYTVSGSVALIPNAADSFKGYSSGATLQTTPNSLVWVGTDGASSGTWYITPTPWLNGRINITSGTTVGNQHNGATLALNNCFTLTFPTASTLDPNFRCKIQNAESWPNGGPQGAAQIISINGTSYYLYPGQSYDIFNSNGTWASTPQLGQRFIVPASGGNTAQGQTFGVTLFVSNSGNDSTNDGLSASRPLATLSRAHNLLRTNFDHNSFYPQISAANGTYNESIQSQGPLVGTLLIFLTGGSASGVVWKPVGSTATAYCLLLSDGGIWEIANVKFDGAGLPSNQAQYAVYMHQANSIVDFNAGCEFGNFSTYHIGSDHGGPSVNFNASYTISNASTMSAHIQMGPNCCCVISGGITVTINNTPQIQTFYQADGAGSGIYLTPSITYSGSLTAGTQKWLATDLANIQLNGNTPPGSVAGAPVTGSTPWGGVVRA